MDAQENLFVGKDYWHTCELPEEHLDSIMLADGPHGLRKQEGAGDMLGMNESLPAICYPTASAWGCTFDTELIYALGQALGKECVSAGVDVLLGPGVNHKRSPLCGRNFEYISEDPCLTGELAAAYVNGLQSEGIGASVKHFAGNSREWGRMVNNSVIDDRALMEIYLRQFGRIVKKAQPWTIMAAYNKLNGVYACENDWLLNHLARREWGFEGAFVSDWGAVSDPVQSIKNGLNLEMPGCNKGSVEQIQAAKTSGQLTEEMMRERLDTVRKLMQKAYTNQHSGERPSYDIAAHLQLAQRVAEESAVLLKNNGILPVKQERTVALVGAFAKKPRYQGAGSSRINTLKLDSIYEAMRSRNVPFVYEEGYDLEADTVDEEKISSACAAAKGKDVVIVVVGLPDHYESEGFDREHIRMPESHNQLISSLAAVNENIVIVLQGGSVMAMPWLDRVKAVLHMHLSGCQGGKAAVSLLYGDKNPCGKLAETYVFRTDDSPCADTYTSDLLQMEYRESIFSGYRYFDSFNVDVQFPFGYGLSYTSFAYSDLSVNKDNVGYTVCFSLQNTGKHPGAEIAQIYVGMPHSKIVRAKRELKGFKKVYLQPGEKVQVEIHLEQDAFSYYNTASGTWDVEEGSYALEVGASISDIRLKETIRLEGNDSPFTRLKQEMFTLKDGKLTVSKDDFEKMLGYPIPATRSPRPFTKDSTLPELATSPAGKVFADSIMTSMGAATEDAMIMATLKTAPIRALMMVSNEFDRAAMDLLLKHFNES